MAIVERGSFRNGFAYVNAFFDESERAAVNATSGREARKWAKELGFERAELVSANVFTHNHPRLNQSRRYRFIGKGN